jgi:glycosyltransferase involved in cell wall biosynthesis
MTRANEQRKKFSKAIVLVSPNIGGVEIRIARLFRAFYDQDPLVYLVTHQLLLRKLQEAGVLLEKHSDRILLLDSHKQAGLNGFFGRKLIYARWMLRSLLLAWQYNFKAVYLACNGITVAAPLLVYPGVRSVIAYTIPHLRASGITWPNRMMLILWLNLCHRVDALNPVNDLGRIVLKKSKVVISPGSFTDPKRFVPDEHKWPWIVWAGHLEPHKQPLLFVDSVAAARKQLDDKAIGWEFHILGGGNMLPEVQQRIADLQQEKHIQVWGYVHDVASFFAKSVICVSTQRDTNYPSQVLLEAMSCENAVIATDVGDTRLLVDEENAILVNNSEDLTRALITLMTDEELRLRLGQQGRAKVARSHTVEKFIVHVDNLWAPTA